MVASDPAQAKTDGYPCPQCSAPTAFKPGTHELACDHCGELVTIPPADAPIITYDLYAKDTIAAVAASRLANGAREVQCKTCGARAISTRQAERCAFCDSPIVVEVDHDPKAIPPGGLLPFELDRRAAGDSFQRWLRSRWFAPRDLIRRAERDGLDGVYLPYWTYDADTTTAYRGERGEHYYETETYTENGETKTREVRRTRWYPASGTVAVEFEDVLVCGSPSLPEKLVEKLEPWDLVLLRAFDGRYLAGFQAERYRVDAVESFKTAGARMEPEIRHTIKRDIGGDEQRIAHMDVSYDDVGFRHLLLPLWVTAFRYNDKLFHVTVNARTGEVAGERPWSAIKIALLVAVLAAITVAIILLTRK